MVVVSHLFLFYGKISGADVTWYESHLPLFGTIYFPIAPSFCYVSTCLNWCVKSSQLVCQIEPVSQKEPVGSK